MILESGKLFTETGLLLKDIESSGNVANTIVLASEKLRQAAGV
jgi:hypothetical protein